MHDEWKYQNAKRRVQKIKGFYSHLASYLVMSIFFVLLNMFSDSGHFWAIYPILGWGIGLAFHAISVFGFLGTGPDWEERQMRREMARLDRVESGDDFKDLKDHRHIDDSPDDHLELDPPPGKKLTDLEEPRKPEWRDSDFV